LFFELNSYTCDYFPIYVYILQEYLRQVDGPIWQTVLLLLLASKACNTRRQYKNAFNLFCKFCLSFNITLTLPASDTSVSVYLIHLTNAGKSASTINEAFYAISWAHRLAGLADPCKSGSGN
jgi:hypothetical protein